MRLRQLPHLGGAVDFSYVEELRVSDEEILMRYADTAWRMCVALRR